MSERVDSVVMKIALHVLIWGTIIGGFIMCHISAHSLVPALGWYLVF